MTPGSQFKVRTNLDQKPAFKRDVHYELAFFNSLTGEDFSTEFCNNHTMQVNQEGELDLFCSVLKIKNRGLYYF